MGGEGVSGGRHVVAWEHIDDDEEESREDVVYMRGGLITSESCSLSFDTQKHAPAARTHTHTNIHTHHPHLHSQTLPTGELPGGAI